MHKLYGSLVWLIVTLFVVYSFCLNTAAAVFSEPIKQTLSTSDYGVSIATGAFILGFACMQIPAGYFLDKFSPRIVVSGGVFLLAFGNIFISIADNLPVFTFANLIQGVGASFAFVAAAVLISQWFSTKVFPILFGLTQTLSCILAGVLHYYFKVELISHTWNEIYQKLAIFGIILFILSLIIVRAPNKKDTSVSLKSSLLFVFKNKQILLCSLAAAMSFGVLLAYASLWFMPIQNYYSVDTLQSILISSLIFAGIGIGTPLLGWLSNAVKSRLMIIHITLVTGTMALLLGIYLPHYNTSADIITKIVSFFIGFLLSGSMLFYTMVNEISSDNTRGVAISVLNTAVFLFNTLLLFIPYLFITTVSKEFFTYLWILPFFILFSILLIYFIKDTSP
ncbi:MFS transporter [Legionella cincinnatiensis]|uniref:Major facilitator family transporter n=1 Tax=Legionella cincinnatiensis TaxID=28085 RepID=A0A378IKS5_9GAMM|nr:MFS transporter [Legionella cincinnatiensis]KTC83444.1 major facilitator family transporter [Legionella cincinnatiensis]STX35530.1 major facilitator family transporter [Legionella cincinnatiensis]